MNLFQLLFSFRSAIVALAVTVVFCGCSSKPPKVRPINIDAAAAAKRAMVAYDQDSDGKLSDTELEGCAGIRQSKGLMDTDGDGAVSEEELKNRLLKWTEQEMGIRSLKVVVSMNGKPLGDADVEFAPEEFMGEIAKPAYGFTNEEGVANMTHDAKDMPRGAENARGVTNGIFRIKITHPTIAIPAKYNSESVLGQEVAIDTIKSIMRVDL